MKWLKIIDNQTLTNSLEEISTLLNSLNKNNNTITATFDVSELKIIKKSLNEVAAAIIYTENQDKISADFVTNLSLFSGILNEKGIFIVTNLNFILKNPLLEKSFLIEIQDNDICKCINNNYSNITENAKKRIAKNKLLDRGIPFTSDCFATYIAKNKMEIFNEFLEAGMEVNCRDDLGTPMLNIACRNDNFEFVEVLLDLGAELNAISEDRGYTAVMDAVWRGNEKITKYLIDKGAELNTINKEGQTNLVLAVGANRENIVKLLAENGADPDVKDMMGMSAYNYATLFKKQKLVDILKPYHKE